MTRDYPGFSSKMIALGREPFCRFFSLLGVRPVPVEGPEEAVQAVKALEADRLASVVLVEEKFFEEAEKAIGERRPFILCPLPGPAGGEGTAARRIAAALTRAIGSRTVEL